MRASYFVLVSAGVGVAFGFGVGVGGVLGSDARSAAAAASARCASSFETGEYNLSTWPIFRPASKTGAPSLMPAALSR